MITRQSNNKLLHQLLNQRSKTPKNIHSLKNDDQLFDQCPQPDSVSIRTSMLSHLRQNRHREALRIFKSELRMGLRCKNIDNAVITLALKACRSEPRLGREIHGYAVSSGFIRFPTVSNSLMNMYSKSGKFDSALCVFKGLDDPCVVAWNTILSGFRKSEEALRFASRMNCDGVEFDPVSYTTILGFCSEPEEFLFGIQLHCLVLKSGLDCELFVGNALISFYSRCNILLDARKVFEEMPSRDLVTWNAILSGYTQGEDHGAEAISIFVAMARERKDLDHISFTSAVSACGHERNLELGKQIHGSAIKSGFGNHLSVCNVLMSTYSKNKAIEDAKLVFWDMKERNVVSWTSIISINEENAVSLFKKMRSDGVTPNEVTFIGLLHAITTKNSIVEGRAVHGFSVKAGFLSEIHVPNSLITMYAKFDSSMEACSKLFDEIHFSRDITSWNCLISGYTQNEFHREALEAFLSAANEFKPNIYTFGSALGAIADSEDIPLEQGKRIHLRLIKLGLADHEILSGALLDMYAKRGSIVESRRVFDETTPEKRTRFAWTAMISGYAAHGDQASTTRLFREMVEEERIDPDSVTFLSVLTACSRKGSIEEGQKIFDSMVEEHGIEPGREHFACMVDMYGRAGRVELAEEMSKRVPDGPGLSGLQSLLGACLVHKDEAEIGERAVRALMDLGPNESGPYVLASNMFAERGDWESVAAIRRGMRRRGVKKVVGLSRADVGGPAGLHGFSAGDRSHPKSDEIFATARCLGWDMKSLSEDPYSSALAE